MLKPMYEIYFCVGRQNFVFMAMITLGSIEQYTRGINPYMVRDFVALVVNPLKISQCAIPSSCKFRYMMKSTNRMDIIKF